MQHKQKYRLFVAILTLLLAAGAYNYIKDAEIEKEMQERQETESLSGDAENAAKKEDDEAVPEGVGSSEEKTEASLPGEKIIEGIPFTSQSPFGDWADPRQQHGCEEASLLMAHYWMTGEALSKEKALMEIFAMSAYEEENYGEVHDLSLEDTLKFYREYFGYKKSFVRFDIDTEDIKREIAKGNPVIVPMDGTKLGNPYYTAPGPERHELIIKGYDDAAGEFITNDPGTRFGEDYRYEYETFMGAIRAYETGNEVPITNARKGALVIERE
jgi:hypothetical protein